MQVTIKELRKNQVVFEGRQDQFERIVMQEHERANEAEKLRDEAIRLRDEAIRLREEADRLRVFETAKSDTLAQQLEQARPNAITTEEARKLVDAALSLAVVEILKEIRETIIQPLKTDMTTQQQALKSDIAKVRSDSQSYASGQVNTAVHKLEVSPRSLLLRDSLLLR